jgi:dolichol kinase
MLPELIHGLGIAVIYFLICVTGALLLHRFFTVPKEVFRKILHLIILGSIFVWTYVFHTWWVAVIAVLGFIAVVFPFLMIAERLVPGYTDLLTERRAGEVKTSLLGAFAMFALVIAVCWGLLGERYLVLAAVLAWGLGDAAAALIGKRFGRHHVEGKHIEGRKSLEGTLAMFVVSFAVVFLVLLIHGAALRFEFIPIAFVTAAVCTAAELFTRYGLDNITCPLAAASVLIPLVTLAVR